jgi:hypothetical protein
MPCSVHTVLKAISQGHGTARQRRGMAYWIHEVFRAREEEEFHTLFGRLKEDRQKPFKYFRMRFSKFENFKSYCTQTLKRRMHDEDGE